MAIIMDGKALAAKMQDHLHEKVERLKEKEWIVPGLCLGGPARRMVSPTVCEQ